MFVDNLIAGVGIGQFTYAYSQYVPDWALAIPEVQAYISGDIDRRINAFNLILRIYHVTTEIIYNPHIVIVIISWFNQYS